MTTTDRPHGKRRRERIELSGRNPYELINSVDLTPMAISILDFLYDMRVARTQQIFESCGGSCKRHLQQQLQTLYEYRFVDRFFPKVDKGTGQGIYMLDQLGAHYLAAVTESQRRDIWDPRDNLLKEDKLIHTLNISQIRAALETDAKRYLKQGLMVEQFHGERRVGRRSFQHHGQHEINPDAEIRLVQQTGEGETFTKIMTIYLIEYDRGTEDPKKLAEKFKKYRDYYNSHEYREYYTENGYPDPILVIVTDGDLSVQRIKNAIAQEQTLTARAIVKQVRFEELLKSPVRQLISYAVPADLAAK